jgi:hypothetical protein
MFTSWRRGPRPEVATVLDSDLGECSRGRATRTSPMNDGLLGPKLALGQQLQCETGYDCRGPRTTKFHTWMIRRRAGALLAPK